MLILAYDENDNIVHIKDAEKGKSYRCPDCGAEVRPRKGTKKTHHFFHMNAEDCGNSGESIVHKYYKELIASQKTVQYNGIEMIVTNSKIEQTLPNLLTDSHIIADVMLELNGYKWIAVEVCYKNRKDENHVDIYNALNMQCFEVCVCMNDEKTDFKVVDYKEIAGTQQITQAITSQYNIGADEKDSAIKQLTEQHESFSVEVESDVLKSTGYYLSQITDEYMIGYKNYTFLQLMNEIHYNVRKYGNKTNITKIELYVKKLECWGYYLDINIFNNNELLYTMQDVRAKNENKYHFGQEVDNVIKRLHDALVIKYTYNYTIEYATKFDKYSGWTKTKKGKWIRDKIYKHWYDYIELGRRKKRAIDITIVIDDTVDELKHIEFYNL